MHQTKTRLLHGEYIGTDPHLYGQTAMLLVRDTGGIVKAQFDSKELGQLAFGWHEFPASQWEINWDFDGQ